MLNSALKRVFGGPRRGNPRRVCCRVLQLVDLTSRFSDQCTGYLWHENRENRRGKEGLQGDSLGLGPCIPVSILLCRLGISTSGSRLRALLDQEQTEKCEQKIRFFSHTMCMFEQGAIYGTLEGYLPSNRKLKLPDVIETAGFFFKATDLTGNTHSTGSSPKK